MPTMPTTPTVPLSPTTLLPALHPLDWSRRRSLSDDGFSDSLAYIALSHELCTGFTSAGRDVSYRGLGELDLSAHRAWDVAALGATEATFLGSAALAIAACVVAIVGLDDLWLLGGFGVRYVAYAAATVGSLAAVTAFVAGFGARLRKVLGALRD